MAESKNVSRETLEEIETEEKENKISRWKNPSFYTVLIPFTVSYIYQLLAMLGIVPTVAENSVENLLLQLVNLLALLGIFSNPTTKGFKD